MSLSRRRGRLVLVALVLVPGLAAACAGCSWLVGVSEDPVVVDSASADGAAGEAAIGRDATAADGADAARDASVDAPEDAPQDAEEDV